MSKTSGNVSYVCSYTYVHTLCSYMFKFLCMVRSKKTSGHDDKQNIVLEKYRHA